ncbi:EAL domain-containing protein, partial [Phenylobacterium sp.]|uniref:EAL domain-containing protein n=1 Tax=Phenylobacterium sp. TaxID=1871053 RepID=UPI00286DE95B
MLAAGFALCYTFHGLIMHSLENAALRRELENIREAQRILIDQMERMDARVVEVVDTVTDDAARRSEELTGEVHMLEDLVQRMRTRLDESGGDVVFARPSAAADPRQQGALLETVRAALTEGRVDLYLQPVVSLPQRRTVFYESFTRLRDPSGQIIMPAEYLAVAEPGGMVTAIDNLLLFRCVQIVRRLAAQDRRVGIFCNVSMASLGDDEFFPQFHDLLRANRD